MMDGSDLLKQLNEQQRQVVAAPLNNLLVLAGAGSGKTRVLVQRIAWLIEVEHISPHSIIAVTFTNKAAAEMRARLESLLRVPVRAMWVGTFHSLAHRLLRMHYDKANLPEHFQILDSDDQYRLIRRTMKALQLSENEWSPKEVQWFINKKKDDGLRPKHINSQGDFYLTTMVRIYQHYEDACTRGGLIDFAEILLRAHELWLNHPDILQHYQHRFQHILIDEFQDTNTIQYAWIKLLAGANNKTMVVGDDDQSIYGWRGAKIENIRKFQCDYSDTMLIRLEQNYRSTATILNAANALIDHNAKRMGKKLWTDGQAGEAIELYGAYNDLDEARFIVDYLQQWRREHDVSYQDIAILYRSNAQSRILEEALLYAAIPYRVYGGLRFFERAEIKDALAYLRLLASRDNDAAFERVVNNPPRGIGERTAALLRQIAREQGCSLWQAAITITNEQQLSARANNAVVSFLKLIDQLDEETQSFNIEDQLDHIIKHSGLWAQLNKNKNEKTQSRLENLEELVNAAQQFRVQLDDNEITPLDAFLTHAVLESGEAQAENNSEYVQLMTLHTAKGLEFPLVFITGMEEGLFPHNLSINDETRLEEERRLCYVGMTRAMQQLVISYAEVRRQYGKQEYHRPSRFVQEIPSQYLKTIRLKSTVKKQSTAKISRLNVKAIPETEYRIGQVVQHTKFGEGIILNYEGSGSNTRVQIQFASGDCKWLVLSYAKLSA